MKADATRVGRVASVHFTVSHRQPQRIAIDKQPDEEAGRVPEVY
jgi:hypothetical protein